MQQTKRKDNIQRAKGSNNYQKPKKQKSDKVEIIGIITDCLSNNLYRVQSEINKEHSVIAHLSGRLRQFNIHVMPGDKVRMEVSTYDLNRGIIVYRLK